MAATTKRLYHPTLPTFRDVPLADVEAWAEAGWRKTKPKGVQVDDSVPVLEVTDLPK